MMIRKLKTATLGSLLMLAATTAQATIIPVGVTFGDPGWSGSASYDDTTGQVLTINPSFTAFSITSMAITRTGIATWDESEIESSWVPPTGGLLLDSVGTAALLLSAVDTLSGFRIDANIALNPDNTLIAQASFFTDIPREPEATYAASATVPEAGIFSLLSLGLAGLAWSRRNRV